MTKKLSEAEKAERAKAREGGGSKRKPGTKPVKQSARAQEHEAEGQQVRQVISAEKLKSLARKVSLAIDRAAEEGGVAGAAISESVKKFGLNAPAFRIAHRMLRVGKRDAVKLRTLLDDLDYYRDALELDKLAGESLFKLSPFGQGAEEEAEAETDTSNVANLSEHRESA